MTLTVQTMTLIQATACTSGKTTTGCPHVDMDNIYAATSVTGSVTKDAFAICIRSDAVAKKGATLRANISMLNAMR